MSTSDAFAPGWPGIPARWTSSAKSGVGTALSDDSRLWFTVSHGVVDEVYYPRIDHACTRDMELIVTSDGGFLSEEKRNTTSHISQLSPGVPAYHIVNDCTDARYRIEKDLLADPHRPVLLQRTRFTALHGARRSYHVHVLLAPHLANRGDDNTGWIGDHKGVQMLFAERAGSALALACSTPWVQRSVGFVGTSDGWHDLQAHGAMTWQYQRAENGNIALMAELDLELHDGECLLVLAFGANAAEAGHRARAALHDGFDAAEKEYVRRWDAWQDRLHRLDDDRLDDPGDRYRVSTMVMRTHESTSFPGGTIASLSIPWGSSKGDEDLGGYHLVWPRDLVETAGGLLAAGADDQVRSILAYLQATQEWDGHWGQNMWLDGTPYWNGIQMDETALPIVLVDLAHRRGALSDAELPRFWPMVRRSASYLVWNGPVSPQDRWEEDAGYSPFTVATEIAALLAAADLADRQHEPDVATYLRETADVWFDSIDRWMYATNTLLTRQLGVAGYYVRVAPVEDDDGVSRLASSIPVKNVPPEQAHSAACDLVSPDALALVRFGLRAADDPRIVDTLAVIDALLKIDTPAGPCWRRYNGDGYGEHADGAPFDGTGIGRAWPLLTGERAHYALQAGRREEAERLLTTMEGFANDGGFLPEQVWDAADIPERELYFGRPAGSAMPLVWAHAEYVKLRRSLRDGSVFDMPPQTVARYLRDRTRAANAVWRFNHRVRRIAPGKNLRIEALAETTLHWSSDGWNTAHDTPSRDTGLEVQVIDLPAEVLPPGGTLQFTFHWTAANQWEGRDYTVAIEPTAVDQSETA